MYFIVFNFYVFYCFMIFAVSDLHLDQYWDWINDIQSKKRGKLLIYRPKYRIHFPICFVHKMGKNLTFWVDLWSQKVTWLRNGRSDFRKISVGLQRKESLKRRGWKRGGFACAERKCRGGASEPPPPPPSAVKQESRCTWILEGP